MARSKSQAMLNRVDIVNPPQFVAEGYGPNNYGDNKTTWTANTKFTAPFQVGDMTINNSPSFIDNFFGGELDRQGVVKVWEANTVEVMGRVLNNSTGFDLLNWAIKKPQNLTTDPGATNLTPDQSRTWLISAKDSGAKSGANKDKPRLNYIIARGCKVQNATVDIPNKDVVNLSLSMNVQSVFVVTIPWADVAVLPTSNPVGLDPNKAGFDPTAGANLNWDTDKHGLDPAKLTLISKESFATPMKFQDVGAFFYKPTASQATSGDLPTDLQDTSQNLAFQSLNLGVDYTHRMQDSNGYDRTLYLDFAARTGTGTLAMYKSGFDINEDARGDELQTAWLQLNNPATEDAHGKLSITGATAKAHIMAKVPGKLGHQIKIKLAATGSKKTISVNGKNIELSVPSSGTVADVIELIEGDPDARKLVVVNTNAVHTSTVTAIANLTPLAGGTDTSDKLIFENFKFQPSWENLIQQSEATIESKSIQADQITYQKKS